MQDTDALKYIAGKINKSIDDITTDLGMGGAGSYDEYRFSAGVIRGLRMAVSDILDYVEKYGDE